VTQSSVVQFGESDKNESEFIKELIKEALDGREKIAWEKEVEEW